MGSQLRVFTGNLKNGEADASALGELLRACDPDVAVFQELSPAQADVIGTVFSHGQLEPARDFTGMGIALRGPASFGRVPLVYRDARVARLAVPDWPQLPAPIEIADVHISSPTASPWWGQPWRRTRQVQGLDAYLAASRGSARVVLGDFNATPAWPVYRRVARHLEDLAATHARRVGKAPAPTWGPRVGGAAWLRIDHCFGRGVEVEDVEVVEIRGSDHRGVVVGLSLKADSQSSQRDRPPPRRSL